MRKPSIIIGKKQIVLTCLTALLATAVYLNYTYAGSDLTAVSTPVSEITGNYGDTEFVSAEPAPYAEQELSVEAEPDAASDFCARARLEKTTSRDKAVQTLQMIMGGGDLSEQEAVTTALDAVTVSGLIESEGKIENLIRSQGFSDCVVYLDGESAKVVVCSDGLEAKDAALIKDIILGEVTISSENIRIFEAK